MDWNRPMIRITEQNGVHILPKHQSPFTRRILSKSIWTLTNIVREGTGRRNTTA